MTKASDCWLAAKQAWLKQHESHIKEIDTAIENAVSQGLGRIKIGVVCPYTVGYQELRGVAIDRGGYSQNLLTELIILKTSTFFNRITQYLQGRDFEIYWRTQPTKEYGLEFITSQVLEIIWDKEI